MANVVTHPHLQVGFGRIGHSPAPLGFGFGLSATPAMPAWANPVHQQQPSWAPQPPPAQPARTTKRRLSPEDDDGRDESMDKSPPPDRPRRAAPKRARTTPATVTEGKGHSATSKENQPPNTSEEEVDVGFLLASLPPQSLLPLVTSLITAQPSLKPMILSLIPRPSLDAALQALAASAQKLKDAYPYSNPMEAHGAPSLWNNTGGFGSNRAGASSFSTGFGFGAQPSGGAFGSAQAPGTGMREDYILNRLRPHIADFVSACYSYLPYFSNLPVDQGAPSSSRSRAVQSHAAALQQQHKDKLHPTETYQFLAALTSHILSQPSLTQSSLGPTLAPRLSEEWKAWVDQVDEVVNRSGGMFGRDTVSTWERGLDEFAEAKGHGMEALKDVRDRWVFKVGWLVGRQPMVH